MPHSTEKITKTTCRRSVLLVILCALFTCGPVNAKPTETVRALQLLTDQRLMLTAELDQFRETLEMVHHDDTPPEQSPNSAVRTLAIGAVDIKQRLIEITEQEVVLLQQQIITTKNKIRDAQALSVTSASPSADNPADDTTEISAASLDEIGHTLEQEADNVDRLHKLLENYYLELEESSRILPTDEELAQREVAQRDAESLSKIPFSVDKVRLSGSEASKALAHISQRLVDPRIPESRRDIAPICTIKTRLLNTLVSVENRSLKPVGKNHFISKVRLQPGETTISILSDQWNVSLPEHASARDFIITLYRPVDGTPELHVFAVDDLLTEDKPHIPAWLPKELDIKTQAG